MAAEPKRPPPPKSYVPLLLLDDGPTPELPPRPVIGKIIGKIEQLDAQPRKLHVHVLHGCCMQPLDYQLRSLQYPY